MASKRRKEKTGMKQKLSKSFCLAPWTHAYITARSTRKLCCQSLEPTAASVFQVDEPFSLEEYWNSDYIRHVRRSMLAGKKLPECATCDNTPSGFNRYRDHFNLHRFPHLINDAIKNTKSDGTTSLKPVSFDYKFNNLCNFKCRICGPSNSSKIEAEFDKNGWQYSFNDPYFDLKKRKSMSDFQKNIAEKEFKQAISDGRIADIYWAGGEPLLWEQHWKYMTEIIDRGLTKQVFIRYNTNLSIIEYKGKHLFKDILSHFDKFVVHASLDGVGRIGEFLRTGLVYENWLKNFEDGLKNTSHVKNAMIIDVVLTTPGLLGLKDLFDVAVKLNAPVEIGLVRHKPALSPNSVPKPIRDEIINDLISYIKPKVTENTKTILKLLVQMKKNKSDEKFKQKDFRKHFQKDKARLQKIANWRRDGQDGRLSLEEIYKEYPKLLEWWRKC